MIIQCSVLLVLPGGKENRDKMKTQDSQQTLTASLGRESLEVYYQTSTATTQACGSKHAVQVFLICLPFTLRALLVIFLSLIYVPPNTLLHPCLVSPFTDCLICPLMLSEMQQPFCGSLLWGWTWISMPDRRRNKAKMGKRERALSCPTGGKVWEMDGTWGQRKGREVMILTEELPFRVLHKERRNTVSKRRLIHNNSGFFSLLQRSIAPKCNTWQQVTGSTAGGSTEEHTARFLCMCLECVHTCMKWGLELLKWLKQSVNVMYN